MTIEDDFTKIEAELDNIRKLKNRFAFIKRVAREFKYAYQYVTRGFSDKETWSLDMTMAEYILPRLRRFKELHDGYPHDLDEEKWIEVIDTMIKAFEISSNQFNADAMPTVEEYKTMQIGLDNFAKYYMNLWW